MNKKNLSFLLALVLALGVGFDALAANRNVSAPTSSGGPNQANPAYGGVDEVCCVHASTSPVLCHTGRGTVAWFAATLAADADYVEFRDSATANTSSTKLLPRLVLADGDALKYQEFSPSVPFANGLSINSSTNAANTSACAGVNRN